MMEAKAVNYLRIKKNYDEGLWTTRMVWTAYTKGIITAEEYYLITNLYPDVEPDR